MEKTRPNTKSARGASMVEYALLATILGIVLIGSIRFLGVKVAASLNDSTTQFDQAANLGAGAPLGGP